MAPCPLLVGGTGQAELVGLIGWARDRRVASARGSTTPPGNSGRIHEKRFVLVCLFGYRRQALVPLWDFAFFTSLF